MSYTTIIIYLPLDFCERCRRPALLANSELEFLHVPNSYQNYFQAHVNLGAIYAKFFAFILVAESEIAKTTLGIPLTYTKVS